MNKRQSNAEEFLWNSWMRNYYAFGFPSHWCHPQPSNSLIFCVSMLLGNATLREKGENSSEIVRRENTKFYPRRTKRASINFYVNHKLTCLHYTSRSFLLVLNWHQGLTRHPVFGRLFLKRITVIYSELKNYVGMTKLVSISLRYILKWIVSLTRLFHRFQTWIPLVGILV